MVRFGMTARAQATLLDVGHEEWEDEKLNEEEGVDRPLLVRSVFRRDGSRALGFRVFCARTSSLVSIEECRRCPSYRGLSMGLDQTTEVVRCVFQPPEPDPETAPPSFDGALESSIAAAVDQGLFCVEEDVELHTLIRMFVERQVSSLTVVSRGKALLLGVVHESNLIDARGKTARDVMSTSISVSDSSSVRTALRRMAKAHARSVTVVDQSGSPVGTVTDVAALRLIANDVAKATPR